MEVALASFIVCWPICGGKTYYVKAYASNENGTAYGNVLSFTTLTTIPTLTTKEVTDITTNSAQSGGIIVEDGGSNITMRGIVWSNISNPDISNNAGITQDGNGVGNYNSLLSGLKPGQKYYIRAYATNQVGTAYGNEIEFMALAELPIVSTKDVTEVSIYEIISGGNVSYDGGSTVVARGIVWAITDLPTVENNDGKTQDGSGLGEFESYMSELYPNTTYFIRAYATNSVGTAYGNIIQYTTQSGIINIVTKEVENITTKSAYSGGNIILDGGLLVNSRGIVWDNVTNPTLIKNIGLTKDGLGSGEYTSYMDSLTPGMMYYVRAYATNEMGTAYGNTRHFQATPELPVLNTKEANNITHHTAESGGDILYDGGVSIISKGLVWDVKIDVDLFNNAGKTQVEGDLSEFHSVMSNLSPLTTYYYRAYATNQAGTAYGNELSFTTLATIPTISTSPITDITANSAKSGGVGGEEIFSYYFGKK